MQLQTDMTLYRVRLNMQTGEPNYVWIQAKTREIAERNIKYNLHPRATIGSMKPATDPDDGVTIHTVIGNEVQTDTLTKQPEAA